MTEDHVDQLMDNEAGRISRCTAPSGPPDGNAPALTEDPAVPGRQTP